MRHSWLILFLPVVAFAAPSPTPIPRATLYQPSKAELLQTVDHISALAKDAEAQLAKEKDAHLETANALTDSTKQLVTLQKQVQSQTDKLNSTQDKLDKAEKALSWYRWHWWGSWIVFGLGVIAVGFFAFLKVTGKLAVLGTTVASKVP